MSGGIKVTMNKILGYVLVVAMAVGLLVFGVLGGLHYEKLGRSQLFHVLTWGIIGWSVLYFVVRLIFKKTRPEAKQVLQQVAQSQVGLISRYSMYMIVWPIVGGIIIFIVASLFVMVRTGRWPW